MQQTLSGCGSSAMRLAEVGKAQAWGKDERVTHPIRVDCAIQSSRDPDDRDHHACGEAVVLSSMLCSPHTVPCRTRHLEAHYSARCSPGGPATYWTRDLDDHLVSLDTES